MEPVKFKEISDDMIGMDERICSCASRVVDILISMDKCMDELPSSKALKDLLVMEIKEDK